MRPTSYTVATRTTARALLGQMPDACAAAQMGMPTATLRQWRIRAGIPPYRLCRSTVRYITLLRSSPEGLSARQIQDALGVTRQAVFLMLHALARREMVECVTVPSPWHYGGRTHALLWRFSQKDGQGGYRL